MDESNSNTSFDQYYQMIKAEHDSNNAWSAEQAQKAMDYQTEMSNTAHQREVADLKAAGLNPVLSAGGAGATTGSGMMAARSDSNVEALYGLAKQAIDAQIDTANAMARSAKYISGSAGISNLIADDSEAKSAYDIGKQAFAEYLKRKYGISVDTTLALLDKAEDAYEGSNAELFVKAYLGGDSDAYQQLANNFGKAVDSRRKEKSAKLGEAVKNAAKLNAGIGRSLKKALLKKRLK